MICIVFNKNVIMKKFVRVFVSETMKFHRNRMMLRVRISLNFSLIDKSSVNKSR